MQTFGNYMNEWLYGDEGYYNSCSRVGVYGDFYTSVSLSKFFGGVIAKYLLKLLEVKRFSLPLKIIEIGGDKGHLIADIAEFLGIISQDVLYECEWVSVERFAFLAEVQKKNFLKRTGLILQTCTSIEEIQTSEYSSTFIVCNELFDAFACEVIQANKMAFVKNHQIVWGKISSDIIELIKKYDIVEGEISLHLEKFLIKILRKLASVKNWEFLSFDYGDWEARNKINLRIYQNHCIRNFSEVEQNLEAFYQKSDITYDVNFFMIDKIFTSFGAKRLFYQSQGRALVKMGLLDLLEDFAQSVPYESYLKEIGKIKPLISPGGLGERFKAISFCA